MFVVFEIYGMKDLMFWPLKSRYYVTYDHDSGVIRLRMSRASYNYFKL